MFSTFNMLTLRCDNDAENLAVSLNISSYEPLHIPSKLGG